jgi:hypothetical protein
MYADWSPSWLKLLPIFFLTSSLACTGTLESPSVDGGNDGMLADLVHGKELTPIKDQAMVKDKSVVKDLATGKDQPPKDACAPLIFSHPFTSTPSSATKSMAILKPGKGFSAKGWNSNNNGMILYSASKPITSGYVEVQMAGFTNASLAAQSLKFHILSGWQINKNSPQSKWQMRLSPSNIFKVTACEVAAAGKWGECKDAYLKKAINVTSKTAYHTYKFAWNKQAFEFYMDGKLISQAKVTFKKDIIVQYIYLGNDISTAVSMHKEDIYIRNVKIVSNSVCP